MQTHRLKISSHPTGLALSACLAFLAAGCVETNDLGEPWPIDEGGSAEQVPPEESSPEPRDWCLPRPVAYDRASVPSLPEQVDYETLCDIEPVTLSDVAVTRTFARYPDERRVEVVEQDASRTSFAFAEEGHLSLVEIDGSLGFYGVGAGRSTYALDEAGEVVHKTAAEQVFTGDEPWETTLVKTQTFDGDRLVSRIEREGEEGPVLRAFEWRWRDGLLHGSTLVERTGEEVVTQETEWTYDTATGLPTSVERSIQGVVVERHAWNYGADAALANRTSWRRSPESLHQEHGGAVETWRLAPELDTYVSEHVAPGSTEFANVALESSADCAPLPTGRHGYPAREFVYQLGVERGERPAGIGAAHGGTELESNLLADDAWYGHDGLATGHRAGSYDELTAEIFYDADGRMIAASIEATGPGESAKLERERRFDGARLVLDRVVSRAAGDPIERTLAFAYDGEGHLIERTLLHDEAPLARQTWQRDAQGRVVNYATSDTPAWPHRADASHPLLEGLQGAAPLEATSWSWTYDGAHLVARGGGPQKYAQTLSYDADGRLTERLGRFEGEIFANERLAYDTQGRLIESCTSNDGAASERCVRTTYDTLGRVAYRERVSTNEGESTPTSTVIEYNRYVCE